MMDTAALLAEERAFQSSKRKDVPTGVRPQASEEEEIVPRQEVRIPLSLDVLRLAAAKQDSRAPLRALLDELAEKHCRPRSPAFGFELGDYNNDDNEKGLRINWPAVILKLHRAVLASPFVDVLRQHRKSSIRTVPMSFSRDDDGGPQPEQRKKLFAVPALEREAILQRQSSSTLETRLSTDPRSDSMLAPAVPTPTVTPAPTPTTPVRDVALQRTLLEDVPTFTSAETAARSMPTSPVAPVLLPSTPPPSPVAAPGGIVQLAPPVADRSSGLAPFPVPPPSPQHQQQQQQQQQLPLTSLPGLASAPASAASMQGQTVSFESYNIPAVAKNEPQKEKKPKRVRENPFVRARVAVLPSTVFGAPKDREETVDSSADLSLAAAPPAWADFVVYWGGRREDAPPADACAVPLQWILLALNGRHAHDVLLEAYVTQAAFARLQSDASAAAPMKEAANRVLQEQAQHPYLRVIEPATLHARMLQAVKQYQANRFTKGRFNDLLSRLVDAQTPAASAKLLREVEDSLQLMQAAGDHSSLQRLERVLISLLGHEHKEAREFAVVLLNVLYDGHDWQRNTAFKPVIRCVGDAFMVDVEVPAGIVDKQLWIQTSAPSTIAGSPHYVITHTPVRLEGRRVYVELPTFHRSGYYDWRLVSLSSELTFAVVDAKLQGRVIAQPALRTEIMHEVWVELEGAQWDWSGRRVKHGDFRSLANAIDSYRKSGVTCTYVMGALDRITGAQPFCPIDRSVPNKSLGGEAAFREVVAKARQAGVKLLVDATTRISAKGANRKYNALVAHALDENGNRRVIAGTDGLEFDWHDSVQINYRKKAAWDLLVAEMLEWANKGVDGVRLDSAHSWPLILRPNTVELLRLDSDGQHHYTPTEILEGEVAMPRRDEARTYGYYGTEAAKTYANPLFLKITREIWAMHPHFIFIAETHWNREVNAIVSGLVPYTAGLPRALASVYRKSLNKDGSITELPQKCSVRVLYDWYELERRNYPENALILYPSSTHFVPYPTTLYDWSAWAAVDLLYFLPEIPITFIGEHFGWRVSVDINSGDFKGYEGEKRQPLQQICGHYDHRCLLRRTHRVLNSGGLIPLFARGTYGWHDRVFAFARFTEEELVIIAINFNDVDSVFYIDCSPLKDIVKDNNVIYRVADHINPANSHQYYTLPELLYGKTYVTLKPWDSLCLGIYQEVVSPSVERTLFEQSLRRLQKAMQDGVDPATNLIYSLALENLGSLRRFKYALDLLASKKLPSFPQLMQNVLYHATRTSIAEEARVLSYLNVACKESSLDPETRTLYDAILSYNTLGPVVFVTPEIGRFSTVGGIGVMVDDLTLALAALGLDIYIISPYYNFNRKGKTGYLAEEGVKWSQNLVTTVGYDRVEVGVHTGKENGVNLVFLHNFDYFPTPYNSGSAAYQLSTIVLFAKATLEFCCQMRLLPAIVVTNDWFAGLTAAYARYGAFGSTFDGTTFFHLVHNLEEGYEGKIYPDGRDLGYIHQLPRDLLIDPFAPGGAINASRCALMASHQWGTVSKSYRHDLLESSPLKAILRRCPAPFAHSNGLRVGARLAQLAKAAKNHEEAKLMVQRKYFPGAEDPSIPIFSFVGRLTLQKGVHLILNSVRELVQAFNGKIQILVGGQANMKDPYAAQCAWTMQGLRRQFPKNFWADPNEFFTDGVLLSLGCDFGLMPSLFEPSGIVQQEYFSAGTPVIAFKTGGLKDTVFEFLPGMDASGNGFTFEAHTVGDYIYAVKRAMAVYSNPQQYAQLRANAQRSVLDTAIVAEAWTREFCRLRHRMWADPSAVEKETQRVQLALSTDEAQWPKEESRPGSAVPPFIPRPPGVSAPPPSSPGPISREVSIESSGVKP